QRGEPGDRRDQPRARRSCRQWGTLRPQRPLRRHRQRSRRSGHGRGRVFLVEPGGLPGHRRLDHSHADRAGSDPVGRDRSRSRPWRVVQGRNETAAFSTLLTNPPLLMFAACVAVFPLANAAMLPLMASIVTMRSSAWATTLVAASIAAPQIVVAAFSPSVGRWTQRWGRRPILLIGFAALPIRGLLFMVVVDPRLLVAVQLLDGSACWSRSPLPTSRAAPAASIWRRASWAAELASELR